MRLGTACLVLWAGLVAQTTRSVSGTVTDGSGEPVKGAVVQLEDSPQLQIRSYITHEDGKYHFSGLQWNIDYRLRARYHRAEGPVRTLSQFDSRSAKVLNLEVASPK